MPISKLVAYGLTVVATGGGAIVTKSFFPDKECKKDTEKKECTEESEGQSTDGCSPKEKQEECSPKPEASKRR